MKEVLEKNESHINRLKETNKKLSKYFEDNKKVLDELKIKN